MKPTLIVSLLNVCDHTLAFQYSYRCIANGRWALILAIKVLVIQLQLQSLWCICLLFIIWSIVLRSFTTSLDPSPGGSHLLYIYNCILERQSVVKYIHQVYSQVGFILNLAGSSRLAQAIYTYKEAPDVSVKKRSEIVKPVLQQNGHFTDPVVLLCSMLESTPYDHYSGNQPSGGIL